jgi:hypothetical protein
MPITGDSRNYATTNGTAYGAGTVSLIDGSANITFSDSGDATTIQNGDFIFPYMSSTNGYWMALYVSGGSGVNRTVTPTPSGFTSGSFNFFYSLFPRDLGVVTKWNIKQTSQTDEIGIPNTFWRDSLLFDVSGKSMKISVEGFYVDSIANVSGWLHNLQQPCIMTNYTATGNFVWGICEVVYGNVPRAYPCVVTDLSYGFEVGNYKVGSEIKVTYRMEFLTRNPAAYA